MKEPTQIRTLFSRDHTTIFPRLGVFLAGPTPPNGEMLTGWRRKVIEKLKTDQRLGPAMVVVSPEPESGYWEDIDLPEDHELNRMLNKQIPWEWQYLKLCDVTAFWLPTYWTEEKSENYAPNIGPTSRWEFGYFLQEYLKNRTERRFIVGGPEDADSVKWAKRITDIHGIPWHSLAKEDKGELVADSFIEAIADALLEGNWAY
jgi:hypothetical protein